MNNRIKFTKNDESNVIFNGNHYRMIMSRHLYLWFVGAELLVGNMVADFQAIEIRNGSGHILGYISRLTKEQLFPPAEAANA